MEFINYGEQKFLIKYKCKDTGFSQDELDNIKYRSSANMIMKKNDILFFCEELDDVEFKEEK